MATTATTATAAAAAAREPNVIYEGDTVICQTSDGRMFFQDMRKDQYVAQVTKLLVIMRSSLGGVVCVGRSAWARS